jgi:tetratricopeptide (TPR) repeat protein
MRSARRLGTLVVAALVCCGSAPAAAAEPLRSFEVVARGASPVTDGEKRTGTTEAGEVLTVLVADQDKYWVQSPRGLRGWLESSAVVRLADAESVYAQLIRAQPRSPVLYERRARMWQQNGQADKMLADVDRAIELGSKSPAVYVDRGVHLATQGEFDKAIADYDRAQQLGVTEPYLFVNRGVAQLAAGRGEEAVKDFTTAIQRGEKSASVYRNRASAYLAAHEELKAIDDLAEAIRLEPASAAAYHQRGMVWQTMENWDKALADYDQALKLDPQHIPTFSSRGFLWFQRREPAKAIADFDRVIELNPKAAVAYNNRGYNRQLLKNYAEALEDYKTALRLAPNYVLAHQNKAWLLATCPDAAIRDGKQAVQAARTACELSQWKHWPDLKSLAAAYAESGDFDQAIQWQTKVLEMAPEDEGAEEQKVLDAFKKDQPWRDAP